MAQTKLGEHVAITNGELPAIGSTAPDFVLTGRDMKDLSLNRFAGQNLILNIFILMRNIPFNERGRKSCKIEVLKYSFVSTKSTQDVYFSIQINSLA